MRLKQPDLRQNGHSIRGRDPIQIWRDVERIVGSGESQAREDLGFAAFKRNNVDPLGSIWTNGPVADVLAAGEPKGPAAVVGEVAMPIL